MLKYYISERMAGIAMYVRPLDWKWNQPIRCSFAQRSLTVAHLQTQVVSGQVTALHLLQLADVQQLSSKVIS